MDAKTIQRLNRKGRQSIRCKNHNYFEGWYFVTLCSQNREECFGEIIGNNMVLNTVGLIVHYRWLWLQWFYPHVQLDEYIIMPDHLHGIVRLGACRGVPNDFCRGAWPGAPTYPFSPESLAGVFTVTGKSKPLGRLIGAFKTTTSTLIHSMYGFGSGIKVWQRDFNDRVIRSDDELKQIRRYIRENPLHWMQCEKFINDDE